LLQAQLNQAYTQSPNARLSERNVIDLLLDIKNLGIDKQYAV